MKKKIIKTIIVVIVVFFFVVISNVVSTNYVLRRLQDQVLTSWNTSLKEMSYNSGNWVLESWKNSLHQFENDKIDIAFYGDSITMQGEWQRYFPSKRIINLGIAGDSIDGMKDRIVMLNAVNPRKVFIMGGINSITSENIEDSIGRYSQMLEIISRDLPEAEIYVQSTLPTRPIYDPWKKVNNDHIEYLTAE